MRTFVHANALPADRSSRPTPLVLPRGGGREQNRTIFSCFPLRKAHAPRNAIREIRYQSRYAVPRFSRDEFSYDPENGTAETRAARKSPRKQKRSGWKKRRKCDRPVTLLHGSHVPDSRRAISGERKVTRSAIASIARRSGRPSAIEAIGGTDIGLYFLLLSSLPLLLRPPVRETKRGICAAIDVTIIYGRDG